MRDLSSRIEIYGPLEADELSALPLSEEFRLFFEGDERFIRAMLNGVIRSPGGRLSVAMSGEEVAGFLCVLTPGMDDRFEGLSGAVEVAAVEVIPRLRRTGIFRLMFERAFATDLEELIVFAVGDPAFRKEGESLHEFRQRVSAVFAPLGFYPLPTDYAEAHLRRYSVFMVRIGSGVSEERVTAFLDRLRDEGIHEKHTRVSVALSDSRLRNLVRTDLERHGFDVVSVSAEPSADEDADVVVTQFPAHRGPLTIHVGEGSTLRFERSVVHIPASELSRLPDVIRQRSGRWQRSSITAS